MTTRIIAAAIFVACCKMLHTNAALACPPQAQGRCEAREEYFQGQSVNHFGWKHPRTWSQRYLISDSYFQGATGPVFLYAGNEAPIESYYRSCGLIWENAPRFSALVVFLEHRYYGLSQPLGPDSLHIDPSFLTLEQALADYAIFIAHLKHQLGRPDVPLVAFGGSYGGMLAAWMRLKYPHLVQGAIAASAPIGAFVSEYNRPSYDPSSFWAVVTQDASPEAGASQHCRANVRQTFEVIFKLAKSPNGRRNLSQSFSTCQSLHAAQDMQLAYWIQGAFDAYAMGNYPWPSDYIGGTEQHPLPAWPMRAACRHLNHSQPSDDQLLQGMRAAVNLLYNATQDVGCYNVTSLVGPAGPGRAWLYQWCTQRLAQELPYFPANGRTDMFWDQGPFDADAIEKECQQLFAVQPRPDWIPVQYGGFDIRNASNIVFSNGLYDPWSSAGIMKDLSETLNAVVIPEGAHHLDLMFSHPDDPPSVQSAREAELAHIRRWIAC